MVKPFDYSRKIIFECKTDTSVTDAGRVFSQENIGSILVQDEEGAYVGMLTDKVLFKSIAKGLDLTCLSVGDLELEKLVRVPKNAGIDEIYDSFRNNKSGRLVMVDDEDKVVGILKKKNIDRFSIYKSAYNNLKR